MLLAVEGGGFFSSSASGYSHGLSLLLLGRKTDETKNQKPVKISPFTTQYHLVKNDSKKNDEQQTRQLAASCRCTVLGCFGCNPSEIEKVSEIRVLEEEDKRGGVGGLKSNLKRDSSVSGDAEVARESVEGQNGNFERRKVQWTDTCGKELVEIREFEASERGASDDESENEVFRKCECTIM